MSNDEIKNEAVLEQPDLSANEAAESVAIKKLNIKIKNYQSIKNIDLSINKKSPNLIAIIGENNVGKTSLLKVISKLSGSSRFQSKKNGDQQEDRTMYNDGTISSSPPSIELSFLFEEEDSNKKFESLLKTAINTENYYLPISFDVEYIKNIRKEITSNISLLLKMQENNQTGKAYFLQESFWKKNTFEDSFRYSFYLAEIKKLKNKTLTQFVEKTRKLYLKLEDVSKTKLTIKYFNEFNIFQLTDLNLNILLEDDLNWD
ncbi:MAG: AAA family ATPase, partial [Metamycoplasmataceae bacterium]